MTDVLIGIGTNKGDRAAHLARARRALLDLPQTRLRAMSAPIETAAEGGVAKGDFLNAAARLETSLAPRDLLAALKAIETSAGRAPVDRRRRWGDRELDLDILLYGNAVIDEPGLTVPHPRMGERRFVLEPAREIAGEMVHPVLGETIDQLCAVLGPATSESADHE